MAKRRKKAGKKETAGTAFQASDMAWLADEYQRRAKLEPSLTLEEFGLEYGVPADELRRHSPDLIDANDNVVILWHGTTKSRAESILKEGFRVKRRKKERRIFFAGKQKMAKMIAQLRAGGEDGVPVVFRCRIDLDRYDDYERRGNAIYAFRHECIGNDVIEEIIEPSGNYRIIFERPKREHEKKSADIILTFNANRAGIACWINTYLDADDDPGIPEESALVDQIKQWLDEQAYAGRSGKVPYNEILEQLENIGK